MPKISQGHIKSWRILLPAVDEQRKIVEKINTDCKPLDTAVSRLENEIELLREYRTRLVADVVTGKLDVRAIAATLPDTPAQGDDNDAGFDDDALDDALDDAPNTDDMDAAA